MYPSLVAKSSKLFNNSSSSSTISNFINTKYGINSVETLAKIQALLVFLSWLCVSAKNQMCLTVRWLLSMAYNGLGYGFVAEKSAGIFPMNNEYTKKR
jgi:hypothetical protein